MALYQNYLRDYALLRLNPLNRDSAMVFSNPVSHGYGFMPLLKPRDHSQRPNNNECQINRRCRTVSATRTCGFQPTSDSWHGILRLSALNSRELLEYYIQRIQKHNSRISTRRYHESGRRSSAKQMRPMQWLVVAKTWDHCMAYP